MKRNSEIWVWLFIGAGAFLVLQKIDRYVLISGPRCDLDILLTAGKNFFEKAIVYRLDDLNEHTKPPLLNPVLAGLWLLPREAVRISLDLFNVFSPFLIFFLWRALLPTGQRVHGKTILAFGTTALFFLRKPWQAEIELGQYNLLLLSMTLSAALLVQRGSALLSGALTGVLLLIKPTQLFFVPWILLHQSRHPWRSIRNWLVGAAICLTSLSLVYVSCRATESLWLDHQEWLHFLSLSTQKHIGRTDNFSLLSILSRAGFHEVVSTSTSLAALAILSGSILCFSVSRSRVFFWSAWTSLCFSPMGWWQNFVILLPLAFQASFSLSMRTTLPFLFFCLIKPSWLGTTFQQLWYAAALPLWLMLLAILAESRNENHKKI